MATPKPNRAPRQADPEAAAAAALQAAADNGVPVPPSLTPTGDTPNQHTYPPPDQHAACTPIPGVGGHQSYIGGAAPTRIQEMLTARYQSSPLSPSGKDFIAKLKEFAQSRHQLCPLVILEHTVGGVPVVVISDAARTTSVVIILQESATHNDIPYQEDPAWMGRLAVTLGCKATTGDISVDKTPQPRPCTWFVLTPNDYPKAEQAYVAVCDKLASATIATPFTLRSFLPVSNNGTQVPCQLYRSSDMNAVRDFVARNSPHAVPNRMDYGFLLCIKTDDTRPTNGMHRLGPDGIPEGFTPIAAVGAYTQLHRTKPQQGYGMSTNGTEFQPVVAINEICTMFDDVGILPLLLTVAAQDFIFGNGWVRTFNLRDRDFLSAIVDNGKPLASTDEAEMMRALFMACNNRMPYLALNVNTGRSRIPYLDGIVSPAMARANNPEGRSNFETKFNTSINKNALTEYCAQMFGWFTGSVQATLGQQHRILPLEEFDYFRMVKLGHEPLKYESLLGNIADPTVYRRMIGEIYELQPANGRIAQVIFRPEWLSAVGAAVVENGYFHVDDDRQMEAFGSFRPLNLTPPDYSVYQTAREKNGTMFTQYTPGYAGSSNSLVL